MVMVYMPTGLDSANALPRVASNHSRRRTVMVHCMRPLRLTGMCNGNVRNGSSDSMSRYGHGCGALRAQPPRCGRPSSAISPRASAARVGYVHSADEVADILRENTALEGRNAKLLEKVEDLEKVIQRLWQRGRSAALGAVPLLDAPRRHPVEELEKVVLDADDV